MKPTTPKTLLEWIYLKEAGGFDDYVPGYGSIPKGTQRQLFDPKKMLPPRGAFKHLPPEASNPKRFTAENFFLVETEDEEGEGMFLINTKDFLNVLAKNNGALTPSKPFEYAAGYASGQRLGGSAVGKCGGAFSVGFSTGNPRYPGAGYACYAFLSKKYGALTSDREHHTSNAAKKTWARIEQDPEWERVPLDNFIGTYSSFGEEDTDLEWYDIRDSWPNRKIKGRARPATPDPSDDCKLPAEDKYGIDNKLGTADAWRYTGSSLDPTPLLAKGQEVIASVSEEHALNPKRLRNDLEKQSWPFFQDLYKGITG